MQNNVESFGMNDDNTKGNAMQKLEWKFKPLRIEYTQITRRNMRQIKFSRYYNYTPNLSTRMEFVMDSI